MARRITPDQIEKLCEAHRKGGSYRVVGKEAKMSYKSAEIHLRALGLKPNHPVTSECVIRLEDLLKKVFDENKPDESFTADEIRAKLGYSNYRIDEKDFKKKLALCVESGIYREINDDGVLKYQLVT